jgi:hypothetical protein
MQHMGIAKSSSNQAVRPSTAFGRAPLSRFKNRAGPPNQAYTTL